MGLSFGLNEIAGLENSAENVLVIEWVIAGWSLPEAGDFRQGECVPSDTQDPFINTEMTSVYMKNVSMSNTP